MLMNEAHGVGQPGWNLDSITPHLQLWRKFTSASHTSVSLSPKKKKKVGEGTVPILLGYCED